MSEPTYNANTNWVNKTPTEAQMEFLEGWIQAEREKKRKVYAIEYQGKSWDKRDWEFTLVIKSTLEAAKASIEEGYSGLFIWAEGKDYGHRFWTPQIPSLHWRIWEIEVDKES